MATKNFTVSADTSFETTAGYFAGGGTNDFAFVGKEGFSSSIWRAPVKFNLDWTGVQSITSAVLHFRTSTSGWMGGSPTYFVRRVTSAWVESPAGGTAGPTDTATDQASGTLTGGSPGFGVWYTADITNIVKVWAPTSIPGGGGGTNNGVQFRSQNEASSAAGWTLATRESAYDAYIVLTYTSNTAPSAPTLNDPTAGEVVASQTPTLNFTPSDPQGDTHTAYTYQVDDNSTFISPFDDIEVTGSFANGTPINRVVVTTLGRGSTYYWRAKTKDATVYGPYAAGQAFKIGSLPTASVTVPAAGHTAELWYTAGTSTTPKIKVTWSFSDADGHAQTHYRVYLYADSGGSPGTNVYDSGWVAGSGTSHNTTYAATNGTKYHVSVQVRCSLTLESVESTKNICRVRWGRASYFFDGTATPTSLGVSNSQTVDAHEALVLEYATSSGTSEPSTWYANISSAGLNRYFWHRVTMWGWGSATPSSPDLNSVTWSYSTLAIALDRWTMATGAVVDTGTWVYGTQSLRHDCNGAAQRSYQLINVLPDKDIVLSARMKVSGNPAAKIRILSDDGTVELAKADAPTATTDWAKYVTPSINTGSETQLRVEAYSDAAGGNTVWFDAFKLEESTVATPWTPGFVSGAVTVDAGGLGVDASKGGVMRFRGGSGTADDIVELGGHGLLFGGDVNVYHQVPRTLLMTSTDTSGALEVAIQGPSGQRGLFGVSLAGDTNDRIILEGSGSLNGIDIGPGNASRDVRIERPAAKTLGFGTPTGNQLLLRMGGTTFPSSPATNDLFYRTDLGMMFTYDGTRWISTSFFEWILPINAPQTIPVAATATNLNVVQLPTVRGGTDLWLVNHTCTFFVASGGTALGASHKWVGTVKRSNVTGGTLTTMATVNIDSGSSAVYRRATTSIGALADPANNWLWLSTWTKTGSPGDLSVWEAITYRIVTT